MLNVPFRILAWLVSMALVDPLVWASTPGMGRAPLLPDPVTQNPAQDIARRLIQATGQPEDNRVMPGDRPIGAWVRDPLTMSPQERLGEYAAQGGLNQGMGTEAAISAPGTVMGSLAGLGVGTVMSAMGRAGVDERQRDLARAITSEREEARARYAMGQREARQAFEDFGRDRRDVVPRSGPGSPRALPKPKETGTHQGGGDRPGGSGGARDYSGNQSRDTSRGYAF